MAAVVHSLGTFPCMSASLQKWRSSLCRRGSFQTDGGMLSSPGALDGLIDLMTDVNSSKVKGLQSIESSSDTLWLKNGVERSGPGRSSPITKQALEVVKPDFQTFITIFPGYFC